MNFRTACFAAAALLATPLAAGTSALEAEAMALDLLADRLGGYEIADVDQDGGFEALVTYEDDCGLAGCLFSIVDISADGSLAEVAYQYGEGPELVSDFTVVAANGVFWTWDGRRLLPYYDRFTPSLSTRGDPLLRQKILKQSPWLTGLRTHDIEVLELDLMGDTRPERFVWLDGSQYAVAQRSPYFIFDAEGTVVTTGTFLDRPFIFPLASRKGAAILTQSGAGFETFILE